MTDLETDDTDRARVRVPLPRLRPGKSAVVGDVLAGLDDIDRLQSMGICRGREVVLVRRGDPLIVRVLGSRIGVSARLAARVVVDARTSDTLAIDTP